MRGLFAYWLLHSMHTKPVLTKFSGVRLSP